MTETQHAIRSASTADLDLMVLGDVPHQDENRAIVAAARWQIARSEILQLMVAGPAVGDSIHRLIDEALALQSDRVLLGFSTGVDDPEHFLSLANALVFLLQHPDPDASDNRPRSVVGLSPEQQLSYPTAAALLAQLKALDFKTYLRTQWGKYADARAPGTPWSRRAFAVRLLRQHLEAAMQMALAQGTLDTPQVAPALAIVNASAAPANTDAVPVVARQIVLKFTNGRRVQVPGAFVMAQTTRQLLYCPGSQVALRSFAQHSELDAWLLTQPQIFPGIIRFDDGCSIEYVQVAQPLETAIEQLLELAADAQFDDMRRGLKGESANACGNVLREVTEADRQRRAVPLFAAAPSVIEEGPGEEMDDAFNLFGLMTTDVPLSARRRTVVQQQALLEAFLGDDIHARQDEGRFQQLITLRQTLLDTEQRAAAAASALSGTRTLLKMLELRHQPNPDYSALALARRDGLRAEARLQGLLKQIDGQELRWIEAVLDHPLAADRNSEVTVATLTLAVSGDDETPARSASVDEAMVITVAEALQRPDSSHSVLLYCPGVSGGLQRFASRVALEQSLFKASIANQGMSVQLVPMQADPFEFILQNQLYGTEQRAIRLIADHRGTSQAAQQAIDLEKLRIETVASLQVPINEAREQAFARIIEQHQSSVLAGLRPGWLSHLSQSARERFKALINRYIQAMKHAHQIQARDLPAREAFCERLIKERLRTDFALQLPFDVTFDLPDSTTWQKKLHDGVAPGTPMQNVLVASSQRSTMTLTELALGNVDNALWWRLSFRKTSIVTASEEERKTLLDGLSGTYLRTLITELDVAQKYEDLIVSTFKGPVNESAFSLEHRAEVLLEPWRLMLRMQGEAAVHRQQIDERGLQLLDIAISAATPQAYATDGKRIVLWPARLAVGGVDTNDGPTTLSGVTFIEEQISGLTLLYLPDCPDGEYFYQRDSLEAARQRLFELSLHSRWVMYLADRAVAGEYARHLSRINQAMSVNHDHLFGIGSAWPATRSLARLQLDAHMGRLLQAHRDTSRSNRQLDFERYALKSGAMVNYLKMALGMVPFVGAAIALYDAWDSANRAVAAFFRGQVDEGLLQLESVLLSLIDAAMDILPGTSLATGRTPAVARQLTRRRQLSAALSGAMARHGPSLRHARRVADRFDGYEYEHDISLAGLQPETEGPYRNVYRHVLGDFIVRQGHIYQVKLTERTLRLYGTRLKRYQQPIALDDAGEWNTHFAVYGTLFADGLDGGGNAIGHVADGLDPLWPQALRQWLPRWWTDAVYRRQRLLGRSIDAVSRQLDNQHRGTNRALAQYHDLPEARRLPAQAAVDSACVSDIDLAVRQYAQLEQLLPLSRGNKRASVKSLQSQIATVVVNREIHRLDLGKERCLGLLDEISAITDTIAEMPMAQVQVRLDLIRQSRRVRIKLIQTLDQMDGNVDQIAHWRRRVIESEHKKIIADDLVSLETSFSPAKRDYIKTLNYLTIVSNFERVLDPSWFFLQENMRRARALVYDALHAQQNLADVVATRAQRNRVLEECVDVYEQFQRDINAWSVSDGQHFHGESIPALLAYLQKMAGHARNGIKTGILQREGARNSGMRVFETEGNRLMIGVEDVDPITRQRRFTTPGEGRAEQWLPRADGKFRRQNMPAMIQVQSPVDINALLAEARARLAAQAGYLSKVRSYASQNMLSASLEDMLTLEAAALTQRAQRIQGLAPGHVIVQQLLDQAGLLTQTGRRLRIAQTLKSTTPTQGYLDYLIGAGTPEERIVEIQKVGGLQDLGRHPEGGRDILQEFVVMDLTQVPPQPLWYAHFHFKKASPEFNQFHKAHLKTPEQRFLGLKWQQERVRAGAPADPIWRGEIGTVMAARHFQPLF